MASIEDRRNREGRVTSWRVVWREGGKRQSQTLGTLQDAQQWKALLEAAKHDSKAAERALLGSVSLGPTLDDVAKRHLARLTDLTPYTMQTYRRDLRLHISPHLGHIPVEQLTADDVAAWIVALQATGLAPKSIKNIHGLLSAVMSSAVRWRMAPGNPCSETRLPRVSKRDDVRAFLTQGEFMLLLRNMDPFFQPLTLFLVTTGLRFSEAGALTSADFSESGGDVMVTVNKAWKEDREKGRYIGDPKSDAAFRAVQLEPMTARTVGPLAAAAPIGQPIFTMKRGGQLTTQAFRKKAWLPAVAAAQAAGLRKNPRVHDLRHTFASWQLERGAVSIDTLAKIMGHESNATTHKVYSHLMPGSRRDAAAAMGSVVSEMVAGSGAAIAAWAPHALES